MGFIIRGVKNVTRNTIRTFSIIIILALSMGLALTMLLSRQAIAQKIDDIKSNIGNIITISPSGARGFEGGGEPLTTTMYNQVHSTNHVVDVNALLLDRLSSDNSSLVSAIDAGSLGRRNNPDGDGGGGSFANRRSFTPPIVVTGTNSLDGAILQGGGTVALKSGSKFDPSQDKSVALVGTDLASKNNLQTGSTFTAYGTTITVDGIFDSGNRFSNNALVMPLVTVQRLSQQPDQLSSMIVRVDSISNLSSVSDALKTSLGSNADVVSAQDSSAQAVAPLQNIQTISLYSLIGAVIAGAVIIFLTMLMIVRERRREIGVLKALGASNSQIAVQFISESMVFTVLGAVVGVVAGAIFSNSVVKILVETNTTSPQGRGGGRFGGGISRLLLGGQGNINNIHTTGGLNLVVYGLLGAIAIALIGSAIPAYLIGRISPAEVMRGE